MAKVVFHQKIVKENGDVLEMRILQVPSDRAHPEGVRYSLVYIRNQKRLLGYDNFEGKGHHKHFQDKEMPYKFKNVTQLVKDFKKDLHALTRETK